MAVFLPLMVLLAADVTSSTPPLDFSKGLADYTEGGFVYSFTSSATFSREITAEISAQLVVGVCQGEGDSENHELTINISSAQIAWSNNNEFPVNQTPIEDLHNWFSVVRDKKGKVSGVFYPPNESNEVLAFKKTLAEMFSINIDFGTLREDGDSIELIEKLVGPVYYDGGEGNKTSVMKNGSGVLTEVTVIQHSRTVLGQEMTSRSVLKLLPSQSSPSLCDKPAGLIYDDDITITSLKKKVTSSLESVIPLVECAANNNDCYRHLQEHLPQLNENDMSLLLHQYLTESLDSFSLPSAETLLTASCSSSSSVSTTHLLISLLFPSPSNPLPNPILTPRLLLCLTTSLPVDSLVVEKVWSLIAAYSDDVIKSKALLALGAMAKRVQPSNQELATHIVSNLHQLLEEHSGYAVPQILRKHKRSTSSLLPRSLPHSSLHALLIDCLANAGAEESYPTLKHHILLGPLSVRHAALRSMNSYNTPDSADVILSVADPSISGENEDHHSSLIRAARSLYQDHSRRKRDISYLTDPYNSEETRERRDSDSDDVMINVTMPTVGWNKQFGDNNITVNLGRSLTNSFIINTTPQSSTYQFSFHDDMTVKSHLSLAGETAEGSETVDMMKTQLCLEGTATFYTINTFTEPTSERIYQQFLLYGEESSDLVDGFTTAYNQILTSNAAYGGKRDDLISRLDDLINIHYDDVLELVEEAVSKLEAVDDEFFLKTIARGIVSEISSVIITSRDSALAARSGIEIALDDALPTKPRRLNEALLVDGQPFTTHSFHVPYLPFAPQKALINILDVYRSSRDVYEDMRGSVTQVIDLTRLYGPNHDWLAPSIRNLTDSIDTLTNDLTKAINQLPPETSHLDQLNELYDLVNFDLRELLSAFVGVANDVIAESSDLSVLLEGSREAFSTFTLSYDTARSRVDALFGQKFHPLFPRQRRSCDHIRGCGSYPTTFGDHPYGDGIALVMSDEEEEEIVAPVSGYYSLSSSSAVRVTPTEASYSDLTFTIYHITPVSSITESPVYIRGGEPLGVISSQTSPVDGGTYIHLEAHKTVGNVSYTVDPTQFLQPILTPSVSVQYECNDLVTYIGDSVVDRRSLAPETPEEVVYGEPLVDDAIPGHEFQRPVEHLLRAQGTILSGTSVEVLSSNTLVMVGPIPVEFEFRAVGDYELDYSLAFSLRSGQASVSLTPSLLASAHGYVRTSGVQYAIVSLEGSIVEASLPLNISQNFHSWPLSASSRMDMVLAPTSLSLTAQLAQTTGAGEFAVEEILQTDNLWDYNIPAFNRDEFYYKGSLTDESSPEFIPLPYSETDCYIRQLPSDDYHNPLFEIEFSLVEPHGLNSTAYQIGTAPRTDDIIGNSEIQGERIVVPHKLVGGSPIYVSIVATNLNGEESWASCSLSCYDRSPPLARITPIRAYSSHPYQISALFTLFDEFGLDTPLQVAIGTIPGEYGNDIMDWSDFDLSEIDTPPIDEGPLTQFSFRREGRLLTHITTVTRRTSTLSHCAELCLAATDIGCISFDFSTSESTCILHSGIEGPTSTAGIENVFQTPSLQSTSDYTHFERLGVGNSTVKEFANLTLTTNALYYINMRLVNGLGYTSTVSSEPFLVDLTPPSPGYLETVVSDGLEMIHCEDLNVTGLECLEGTTLLNHRVIVDDRGSGVVYNGLTPLLDALFTSTTNYIAANWDGLDDLQSGVYIYQWWVGSELGNDDVISPSDPHMHLIGGQSSWSNTGLATSLNLNDGTYYVSVQAISNVEYGGPLITTIHHSTPYTLDTSPPLLSDVIINYYDTINNQLVFSYNASDEESGLASVDLSLGHTQHDTAILDWTGVGTDGNGTVTVIIPDGIDAWVKLRATNNAGVMSVAVSAIPIRADRSPPTVESYGDGDNEADGDIGYQSNTDSLCVHVSGVSDPESGINQIIWSTGTSLGGSDVVSAIVTDEILNTGFVCVSFSLSHNVTYFSTLSISNGAITNLVTTLYTTVRVDETRPEAGSVVTGRGSEVGSGFSSDVTTVTAAWDNFNDYESGIVRYTVFVSLLSSLTGNYVELYEESVEGNVNDITLDHFTFVSNDSILVEVRAENGAGGRRRVSATPYTIDLSPPQLIYLIDGSNLDSDLDYHDTADLISVSWDVIDFESQISTVEVSLWMMTEGRRLLVFPDPFISPSSRFEIPDISLKSHTITGLNLTQGAHYISVLTVRNGAGLVTEYATDGFTVDLTPPLVSRVSIEGGLLSVDQETGGLITTVVGTNRFNVRWSTIDIESGVYQIRVGVVNDNDTLITSSLTEFDGHSTAGVLTGFQLNEEDVYRIAVIAINNAGIESERTYSQEFRVIAGDEPGRVYDGEDPGLIDVDFIDEVTSVSVHFSGFLSSQCGGVAYFDWAIGEGWEGEEMESVMSFTDSGLIVDDTITGSGYAQVQLPGLSEYGSNPLYITVRGFTDCGDVIITSSDGLIIDPTPPSLHIINTIGLSPSQQGENDRIYQSSPSLSAMWELSDTESGPGSRVTVQIGTYPGGDDVQDSTYSEDNEGAIHSRLSGVEGVPHYVTVTGSNRAGLTATESGTAVVLDTSPPTLGQVNCTMLGFPPPLPLSLSSTSSAVIECHWFNFTDPESGLVTIEIAIFEQDKLIFNTTLLGTELSVRTAPLYLNLSSIYHATLTVTNGAGLSRIADTMFDLYTEDIVYDGMVEVMVNYARSSNETGILERLVATGQDYICLIETDTIGFEFPSPVDTLTDSFKVGVGYYPGTDDIISFTNFSPTLNTNERYSYTLTHFNPLPVGHHPIYITVQVPSSKIARQIFKLSSPPVYINSDINELDSQLVDGTDPNNDAEYQVSTTEIAAHLKIGSNCPVSYIQWSVEDTSGTVVINYLAVPIPPHSERLVSNEFLLRTDQVHLYNEETYRVLVQVKDITGRVFILRSNGVSVTTDELVPNSVRDGPNPNEDLNYQEPMDYLSANWADFGDGTSKQEIVYYEVAAGSNVGHPNTRTDIAPFTNVSLNTTHTFRNLDLIPESILYTITVRATSISGAAIESSSNGIRVGHTHSITAGTITLSPFSSSSNELTVYWEEFNSNVPIREYEWAVGERDFTTYELQTLCTNYLSDFGDIFDILPFSSVGFSTSSFLTGLNLTHNTTYYVTIRARDEANKCLTVISPGMLIDLTPPTPPSLPLILGPPESLIGVAPDTEYIIFVESGADLSVSWSEFEDRESDIEYYEVAILEQSQCGYNNQLTPVTEYINTGSEITFIFQNPPLVPGVPYTVDVRANNFAGLAQSFFSEPILVDGSTVVPGSIHDGLDWQTDVVFQSNLSMLSGVFTHAKLPPPYPGVVLLNDPCPNTLFYSLVEENYDWHYLNPTILTGIDSDKIRYTQEQVNISSSGLTISTVIDDSGQTIVSGGYTTQVDLSQGGIVSVDLQAAIGSADEDVLLEEQSVTSVVFSDTDSDVLADFEFESRQLDIFPSDISAVGLQIHHGYNDIEQKVVLWAKSSNTPSVPVVYTIHDIPGLDLSQIHKYTLHLQSEQQDTDLENWVDLYIDDQLMSTLHSLPQLPNTTQLSLHVFNRDGFVPHPDDLQGFQVRAVRAVFSNVTVPRQRGHLCDYGLPFYSPSAPIVQFSAGVGTSAGLSDILQLQELSTPCHPCNPGPCSSYSCSTNCSAIDPYPFSFSFSNLSLSPGYHTNQSDASSGDFEFESSNNPNTLLSLFTSHYQPAIYYITIQAITASGQHIISSSNGVTIDITSPESTGPIYHFDVTFSHVQYTDYQSSNDTISASWGFRDLESGVIEYQWSIGTSPNTSDVQPLVSVGTLTSGISRGLLGVLEDNMTYYVTVIATNGAGLTASQTSNGITYSSSQLNLTSLEQVVEIEFDRRLVIVEEGEEGVLVVVQGDRAAITWEGVSADVEDIYWYIGTERGMADVLPRTEVSFNASQRAEIDGDLLYLNGVRFATLSEVSREDGGEDGGEGGGGFALEPGRVVFNTLELCNFVHRCVEVGTSPSILIRTNDGEVTADLTDTDLSITIDQVGGQSSEVTDGAYTVTMTTTGGVGPGTVMVAGFLTYSDLLRNYRASMPYISNPYTTMTLTSSEIARRFAAVVGPSFYVSFLGLEDSLSGSLNINTTFDPSQHQEDDILIIDIFYWDQYEEVWREVNSTCGVASTIDWDTFTISAQMCSERVVVGDETGRRRRQVTTPTSSGSGSGSGSGDQGYLSGPVQFIVVGIGNTSANTPPQLQLPSQPLSVTEDSVLSGHQIYYTDAEGDEVDFFLSSPPKLGNVSLTLTGSLSYTPCTYCTGLDSFEILIIEKPFGFNTIPLTASGVVVVEIENINNAPVLYAYDDPTLENSTDVTTDRVLNVLVEGNRSSEVSIAQIVTFDFDGYLDDITVSSAQSGGGSGVAAVVEWLDIVSVLESLPVTALPDVDFIGYVSFVAANVTYLPPTDFTGFDTVKVNARDQNAGRSEELIISIEVIPSFCLNNGVCNGSTTDPGCEDLSTRRSDPGSYSCQCMEGFSGQYCELNTQQPTTPVVTRECRDGIPLVSCDGNPCTNSVCPSNDVAICRPNYCGGCTAEWFVGDTQIQCTADDSSVCSKPTPGPDCFLSGITSCDCPSQPYPCPADSVFVETRHSVCCVTFECVCPDISCPLLMEGDLGIQPVPQYRGNKFPGRCCPLYSFEDIDECENSLCSDVCVNHDNGYSCLCPTDKTLSSNAQDCGVCRFEGREYVLGDRVKIGCNWCVCEDDGVSGERWRCTANSCEPSCYHNGRASQVTDVLHLLFNQVSCLCEETDTYADWKCERN